MCIRDRRHPPRAPGSRTACYQGRVQPRLLRDPHGLRRLQGRRRRSPRLGDFPRDYLGASRLAAGGVADDLKALEVHLLVWPDARFLLGDGDLVEDGVDAFQIGKQKAPAMPASHDDACLLYTSATVTS